jgi:hypothetical protein
MQVNNRNIAAANTIVAKDPAGSGAGVIKPQFADGAGIIGGIGTGVERVEMGLGLASNRIQIGVLTVSFIRCRQLNATSYMVVGELLSPFVEFNLINNNASASSSASMASSRAVASGSVITEIDTRHTKVQRNDPHNPTFEETFRFVVRGRCDDVMLECAVKDRSHTGGERRLFGKVEVELSTVLSARGELEKEYMLESDNSEESYVGFKLSYVVGSMCATDAIDDEDDDEYEIERHLRR